ncbi:MAG: tripartite tricarboxylate transporter TctB family protein [Alkalispirochaeta sp.]
MSNTKSTLASLTELVVPILSVVFSLYYLFTIQDIPFLAQMYGGGISFLLIFLSLVVSIRILVRIMKARQEAAPPSFAEVTRAGRFYSKAIILAIGMAFYIGLMPYVGYPVLSFLFVTAATWVLGVKNVPRAMLMALGVTIAGYLLFIVFLQVRLPMGPVEFLRI